MQDSFKDIIYLINNYYKKSFLIIIIASFALILLDTFSLISIFPMLQSIFSDNVDFKNFKFLNFFFKNQKINFDIILIIFLILFILKFIFTIISNYMIANFKMNLQKNLSKSILRVYLKYDLLNFLALKQSQLIRNITKETEIFVNAAESLIRIFVESSVLLLLFSIIFISFPIYTFYTTMALICVSIVFHFLTKKKLLSWGKQRLIHDGKRINNLNNTFELINEIKLYGQEEVFVKIFNKDNAITQRTQRNRSLISMFLRSSIELGIVLFLIAVLTIVHFNELSLSNILPLIALIFAVLLRFMPGFLRINNAYQIIIFSISSVKEILNILMASKNKIEILAQNNLTKTKITERRLSLNNIFFKYPNKKNYVLGDINLSLDEGDIVGISGKSGSGKTTLISIIMGLLKPSAGEIIFDGRNIDNFLSDYRKNIGYVSQNFSIIDTSIIKNITLNFNDQIIDKEKLETALKISGSQEFINKLDKKLDTNLGQSGFSLSGGQKQRIALARGFYNSKDLLIFDEATTSLDENLSQLIYENLKELSKSRIVIIISHQKNSFKYCNKLFQLKEGKLELVRSV